MTLKPRETLRYFAEELVGVELNPGQADLIDLIDSRQDELREIVVRKGRRIGMTMAASLVAAWYGTVLAPRVRKHVMAREVFRIALVATSRDQASLMLRFIKGFFEDAPLLADQIAWETADTLKLVSGCEIVASVCSARAHRGWPNVLVIVDEAAHYIESEGNMSLASLLEALRPSQSQFGSLALMLAISTPLDASGTFFELEQQATSGQFPDTRHGDGGAIYNVSQGGTSILTIANTSISSQTGSLNPNQAALGGGIYQDATAGQASVTLISGASIAHNKASITGGGIYNLCNGNITLNPGAILLLNTPNNLVNAPCAD